MKILKKKKRLWGFTCNGGLQQDNENIQNEIAIMKKLVTIIIFELK